MSHNSKESNIIEYKGDFFIDNKRLLVLEKLDIDLWDYVESLPQPMRLEDVRTVIQQVAVALNAAKSAGIIHGDVKEDNIMMVDHVKQPFRVKLIDFGMAKYRSEAKAGELFQVLEYRAPEITLGLPYSEAIDVWSLGCVMAGMMTEDSLFGSESDSDSEYWKLRRMIRLLGPPPQHLIDAGRRSRFFFQKTSNGLWRLKTPVEYFVAHVIYSDPTVYEFGSLDEMKTVSSETDNPAEADERRECIELLKAMLRWDEDDRITPSGILNHPFITKSYLNSSSPTSSLPDEDKDLKSSEHEDSDNADTAEDTDDSEDSNDDEDTEMVRHFLMELK
ncbi:homeodomain-interacting protein kinase 1-like [Acanthochromis polyacanthus]|uniref:homeodomain-interacting protein kinase 1-like n=1 Tax=Acanthochromis polyacanthus TaxID=80966 RepID=UPI0022346038|nr:homeodomain-interacting protein kinase 1-like [Acanthochromis polyacanthus]